MLSAEAEFLAVDLASNISTKGPINEALWDPARTLGNSHSFLSRVPWEPCGESHLFPIPKKTASPHPAWGMRPAGYTIPFSCSEWACHHEEHASPCLAGKQTVKGQQEKKNPRHKYTVNISEPTEHNDIKTIAMPTCVP